MISVQSIQYFENNSVKHIRERKKWYFLPVQLCDIQIIVTLWLLDFLSTKMCVPSEQPTQQLSKTINVLSRRCIYRVFHLSIEPRVMTSQICDGWGQPVWWFHLLRSKTLESSDYCWQTPLLIFTEELSNNVFIAVNHCKGLCGPCQSPSGCKITTQYPDLPFCWILQ